MIIEMTKKMTKMKKLIQRIKHFIKPKNMDADQLADTAYIISAIALLVAFVSFLLSTR